MRSTDRQQRLPFELAKESQAERCQRVLAGIPKVQRASSMLFDYESATKLASRQEATEGP